LLSGSAAVSKRRVQMRSSRIHFRASAHEGAAAPRRGSVVVLVLVTIAGCGSGNSVSGTFQGNAFTARDALSYQLPGLSGEVVTTIELTDYGDACSAALNSRNHPNESLLGIFIDHSGPLGTGTFDILSSTLPNIQVLYEKGDALCQVTRNESATSGVVIIDNVGSGGVSGSFNLEFSSDHVTGVFDAPKCQGVGTASADGGSMTCN
jgi:hypothetical protein